MSPGRFRWEGEWHDGDRVIDKVTMEPRDNHSVAVTTMYLGRSSCLGRRPDVVRTVRIEDDYAVWEFDYRDEKFTRCDIDHIAERDGAVLTEDTHAD